MSSSSTKISSLKWWHAFRAANTASAAYVNDPHKEYMAVDQPHPSTTLTARFEFFLNFLYSSRRKVAFQIDGANAVCLGTLASEDPANKPTYFDRLLDKVYSFISRRLFAPRSMEARKRMAERSSQIGSIISSSFGRRMSSMMYLDLVATHPSAQGRGYATRLVRNFVDLSIAHDGREIWLITNKVSEKWYNSLGFVSVGEAVLGKDNPAWDKPVVVLPVMVRAAKSKDK